MPDGLLTNLLRQDVLGALAVVPFPDNGLGVEASGIVRHVGPDVKRLCPGDRVMLREDGTFATHAIASEKLCAKIPSDLSFEDAATMPVVFATAIYSMFDLGGLQEGQVSPPHPCQARGPQC